METKDLVSETFLEKYCAGNIFVTPMFLKTGVCPNCHQHFSQREDVFEVLSVNIPQDSKDGISLQSILNKELGSSPIIDCKCSNCDHEGQIIEYKTLTKAPEILIVKLLRYDHNQVKNMTYIVPEDTIHLQDGTIQYELSSLIDHKGSFISGGHWIVHRKDLCGWTTCNDTLIIEGVSELEVKSHENIIFVYTLNTSIHDLSSSNSNMSVDSIHVDSGSQQSNTFENRFSV